MLHGESVLVGQTNNNYVSIDNSNHIVINLHLWFLVVWRILWKLHKYKCFNITIISNISRKYLKLLFQDFDNIIYWDPPKHINGIFENYQYMLFYNGELVKNQTTSICEIALR